MSLLVESDMDSASAVLMARPIETIIANNVIQKNLLLYMTNLNSDSIFPLLILLAYYGIQRMNFSTLVPN